MPADLTNKLFVCFSASNLLPSASMVRRLRGLRFAIHYLVLFFVHFLSRYRIHVLYRYFFQEIEIMSGANRRLKENNYNWVDTIIRKCISNRFSFDQSLYFSTRRGMCHGILRLYWYLQDISLLCLTGIQINRLI